MVSFDKAMDNAILMGVGKALVILKKKIDDYTPVDTGLLISENKITVPYMRNGKVIGNVRNKTPYMKYVEYGVQGKTYNYHKGKSVFYRGVGARMFTRARFELGKELKQLVEQSLNQSIREFNRKK